MASEEFSLRALVERKTWRPHLREVATRVHFPGWTKICRALFGRVPVAPAVGKRELTGGYWREVQPARPVNWPPFRFWGAAPPPFRLGLPKELRALRLLEGKGLVVMGPHGWVLDAKGCWQDESSWHRRAPELRPQRPFTPPVRKMRGRAAVLCSDWGATNYFHFLLDSLSRLAILEKAGADLESIDLFLVPEPLSPAIEALWERVGIPAAKRLALRPEVALEAETTLVPNFPGEATAPHPIALEYLRRLAKPVQRGRRLFIPRTANHRLLRNEREVQEQLLARGYEVYDPAVEAAGQWDRFAEAEVVIGVHGAALANLAFCAPGTKVIEILPSDHAFPFFYTLSAGAGLDYRCVMAQSEGLRPQEDIGASPYSCTVEWEDLQKAMESLGL